LGKGRDCTVCIHPQRHLIEVGLCYGTPMRVLSKRFGPSFHSIYRHSRHHLSPQLRAAILTAQEPQAIDLEELKASEASGLLAQLVSQRARLQRHSEVAAEIGNIADACRVEGRITDNLRLVAQLLDQLVTHHEVRHTSVLVSADYLALRQALVIALKPYPQAMAAVSAALHRLESEAAQDITARAANGKAPPLIEHQPEAVS
jgi:hypothetical protein